VPADHFFAPFRADRVITATTSRGLAFASAELLRAQLEQIFVSAPARVERGACARSRVRQSQRSAMDAVVQRLYACVVPCVAWEERGLSPLVCERDPHGSRIVLLLLKRFRQGLAETSGGSASKRNIPSSSICLKSGDVAGLKRAARKCKV
jgi:hypothetical protein